MKSAIETQRRKYKVLNVCGSTESRFRSLSMRKNSVYSSFHLALIHCPGQPAVPRLRATQLAIGAEEDQSKRTACLYKGHPVL